MASPVTWISRNVGLNFLTQPLLFVADALVSFVLCLFSDGHYSLYMALCLFNIIDFNVRFEFV